MFDLKMHEELEEMSREDLIVYARELLSQLSDEDSAEIHGQILVQGPPEDY